MRPLINTRHSTVWRKAGYRFAFILVLCASLGLFVERAALQQTKVEARDEALARMGLVRNDIARSLNDNVQRVRGLVGYVLSNPEITQLQFSRIARYLIEDDADIVRNVALARRLVVSHIHPLHGNSTALGLEYRAVAAQWPMVQQAIAQREVTVAGPVNLVQGGKGIIARYPIYLPREGLREQVLWGIASLVLDFDLFLERIRMDRITQSYDVAIHGIDGKGRAGGAFFGDPSSLSERPVSLDVIIPGGTWVMEATPKGGWPQRSGFFWRILGGTGILFAIGCFIILAGARFELALIHSARLVELARQDAVKALEAAERANHAKTLFLANMSHELRTPLNAIIGFSEIMDRGLMGKIENSRYAGYVRDILGSSNHLLALLTDILDITRIESGDVDLNETEISVRDVIDTSLRLIRDRLAERQLTLTVSVPDDLPRLWVDARMIRQTIVNIVENAIKYTNREGTISVVAKRRGDGGLAICVEDTGPGISPEDRQRILEPFVQLRPTADVTYGGSGLGLPIAKKLIEAHGGSLEIDSEVGSWTRVTLTIPRSRVHD